MTEITTAARRIVRAVHAYPTSQAAARRIAFDADGQVLHVLMDQDISPWPSHVAGSIVLSLSSRDRHTHAGVQDMLDAYHDCKQIGRLGWQDEIVDAWQFADQCGNPRLSAARVIELIEQARAQEDRERAEREFEENYL